MDAKTSLMTDAGQIDASELDASFDTNLDSSDDAAFDATNDAGIECTDDLVFSFSFDESDEADCSRIGDSSRRIVWEYNNERGSNVACFDGRSSGIRFSRVRHPSITAFSLQSRFVVDHIPATGRLVLVDVGTMIAVYPEGRIRCRSGEEVREVESDANMVRPGRWHHVECRAERGRLTLVLDGQEVGSNSAAEDLSGAIRTWYVGQDAPRGGDTFSGCLDDVQLWNKR